MFDPETFQPLLKPLQAGSENEVSVQNNASSTATPQHISYETPQPASGKPSLEPLVEDPDSANHLYAASLVRHSPNPGSSVPALSIRNSTLDEHAPVLPSATTYQPSRLSTYDIFSGDVQESVSSPVMATVSFPVLDQTEEKESTYEDPIEREERCQAQREYQCLNYCPTYEVPSAACICLDLLVSRPWAKDLVW